KTMDAETGYLYAVAFSPDGKTLASGPGDSNTIKLWDAQTGEYQASLEGHFSRINTLCFTPDSKRLISGSSDVTMRFWDVAARRQLVMFYPFEPRPDAAGGEGNIPGTVLDYIAVTPEGYYAGTATADRYVSFKLGNDSYAAECFQARYY